jgi:hypothetical protein
VIAGLAALLLFAAGCHDVVEYSTAGSYGVCIIRTSDMVLEECMEGFEGGRSICSLGNSRFLVASNAGVLYLVNSQDRVVEETYQIGAPFSAGYDCMTQVAPGQVYLVGGFGSLIEFDVSSGTVVDVFNAGPSPESICPSLTQQRLYVADSFDRKIREVWTVDNQVYRELELESTVSSIAPFSWPLGFLAAVCSDSDKLYTIELSEFAEVSIDLVDYSSDITLLSDTSVYCVTHPGWSDQNGRVTLGSSLGVEQTSLTLAVTGHPRSVCSKPYGGVFYVASVMEDGTSRILEIDGYLWGTVSSVTIEGYAWDVTTHANGEYLLVLTSN